MDRNVCFYYREEIKLGTIKYKHCGSMLSNPQLIANGTKSEGTLWLPVPAFVLSLFAFITLLDHPHTGRFVSKFFIKT